MNVLSVAGSSSLTSDRNTRVHRGEGGREEGRKEGGMIGRGRKGGRGGALLLDNYFLVLPILG